MHILLVSTVLRFRLAYAATQLRALIELPALCTAIRTFLIPICEKAIAATAAAVS